MVKTFEKKQVFRFLVGGGSAVAVDVMLYHGLLAAETDVKISKAVSYICGAAVGFLINKFWTFESKRFSKTEVLKYILLYTVSACLNATVNKMVLFLTDLWAAAFLFATGVSTFINFLGQKWFVFVGKGNQR